MSPDTLGTAVVTQTSIEYCDFFFPLCFHGLDPKKGEKLSNPVGGFQEEGLTDILLKLNFKCVFITSPWHEGFLDSMKVLLWSTSCVWKFPSCFHLSLFTFFLPAEQMLSKFFPLERISQVSLSSLWKVRMETPSFCEAFHSGCISFRTLWFPRFTEASLLQWCWVTRSDWRACVMTGPLKCMWNPR